MPNPSFHGPGGLWRWVTALLFVAACGEDSGALDPEQMALARSRATWGETKQRQGDSYEYRSRWWIYPQAREHVTIISVRNDQVVRRAYGMAGEPPQWVESGAEIGSHPRGPFDLVGPAATIDELYDWCATDVLPRRSPTTAVALTFHPDGLLGGCEYQPVNCVDTCARGYRMSDLTQMDPL